MSDTNTTTKVNAEFGNKATQTHDSAVSQSWEVGKPNNNVCYFSDQNNYWVESCISEPQRNP